MDRLKGPGFLISQHLPIPGIKLSHQVLGQQYRDERLLSPSPPLPPPPPSCSGAFRGKKGQRKRVQQQLQVPVGALLRRLALQEVQGLLQLVSLCRKPGCAAQDFEKL